MKTKASDFLRGFIPATLLPILGHLLGCASATVSDRSVSAMPPADAPPVVYVAKFELGAATIQSDPGTLTGRPRLFHFRDRDPAEELDHLATVLTQSVVDDLNQSKINARKLSDFSDTPKTGWLVSGDFLEFNAGNRLQKSILGFGAGNEDARLYVTLSDLGRPAGNNILNFNIDSSGNKAPGGGAVALATHNPYSMAAKFVLDRNASEKDIKRAAKQIADQIVEFARSNR